MAQGISNATAQAILALEPTALLEFFQIYYNFAEDEEEFIPIHGGSNGINGTIFWQGVEYLPFPVETTDWEVKADQTLPRPKLTISNQNLLVSLLLRKYGDLNGAKVVRKRVYARFLDATNFPNDSNPFGTPNPNAGFPDEVFYVSHKVSENRMTVELELVSPIELENVKIPNRKIQSQYCSWIYRGYGCGYDGPPAADEYDNKIISKFISNDPVPDFWMVGGNNFLDMSPAQRGQFTELVNANAVNGVGLHGTHKPAESSDQLLYGCQSIKFDQTANAGVYSSIVVSTGFDPNSSGDNLYTFTNESGLSERTVAMWFYPSGDITGASNPFGQVLLDWGGKYGGIEISIQNYTTYNRIIGAIKREASPISEEGDNLLISADGVINKGAWNHVALTFNKGRMRLYVNSEIVASGGAVTDGLLIGQNSEVNAIGARFYNVAGLGAGEFTGQAYQKTSFDGFSGYMQDIRSWKKELSPAEIINVWNGKNFALSSESIIRNSGEYQDGTTYNRGDCVYVQSKKYKVLSRDSIDGFVGLKTYFLCLENGTTSSPLKDSVKWKKDSCGKKIASCKCRFANSPLPYGGFPGTFKYPFDSQTTTY